ncbi:response regulator transcription factor [Mycoplasmatota bacterium]|nr:response regulator transcription factor [Mycoplasmatota bacterium]
MKTKILVCDDERHIRRLISDYLINENYEVIEAIDGEDAIDKFYDNHHIDLIILDVMMPRKNGYDVAKIIRKESDIPIIFLTALGNVQNELEGFESGGDDYISKPFEYSVFIARVNAMLKRNNTIKSHCVNGLEINVNEHYVKVNEETINLTPKEYELLLFLINNKNNTLSREQILNNVWGYDYYGDTRTVDTHVKQLRYKLKNEGNSIITIRGYGYKFEVK